MINVRVKNKPEVVNDRDVLEAVNQAEKELDGIGRILLRESGTEPVIRVMAEAPSDELCRKQVNNVVEIIKSKGYAI